MICIHQNIEVLTTNGVRLVSNYLACVQKTDIYSGKTSFYNIKANDPLDKWIEEVNKRSQEWGDNARHVLISAMPIKQPSAFEIGLSDELERSSREEPA